MSIQQITNHYDNSTYITSNDDKKVKSDVIQKDSNEAVVYEKAKDTKKTYQKDQASIDRLLAEAEESAHKLRDLVERMLLKQGQTLDKSANIYSLLREGKIEVDDETREQARRDIAEDGYWGIEQTSERLFSFAKALSGGDPSKADAMIEAVKKGFKMAEKTWGGELPQISKDTVDRTISKLESWRDSLASDDV